MFKPVETWEQAVRYAIDQCTHIDVGGILDENVEEFAILSHRWEEGEVTFQNMHNPAMVSKMYGFAKTKRSCEHAVDGGYKYVWVDTCCINKQSSAELTEAINSMYQWYSASAVCYAFLSDVRAKSLDRDAKEQQINSSAWFTSWLDFTKAPRSSKYVVFYNQ